MEAYERNNNFNQDDDLLPEFCMEIPKVTGYKDVHSEVEMPPITFEHGCEFLHQFNVEFDQTVSDLYNDKFLLYLRVCKAKDLFFIKSACHAEMKKNITYIVDISIKPNGRVFETQCECGAGEGPLGHCKHIKTVLFACCRFVKTKELKVELSCTEKLMSFHKTKKHKGSPLKARNLNVAGADEVSNFQDFDPRPQRYRNAEEYKDYFYNTCMNFKGISMTPIFQTFPPANVRAYAHDHDYLALTQEDILLNAMKLNQISEHDYQKIEEITRGQNTNERWIEERGKRLQSSNFYRICTATERTDLDKLAESMVLGKSIKTNEAMRHGQKYEREAIQHYEIDFNTKVVKCGIFVSKTLPFIGASPDGIISDKIICEVKCPFSAREKEISPLTVPYLKIKDNALTLSPTHPYYFQIQGQLYCSEREFCHLIIYTLTDIKYIKIERDSEFIAKMLDKLKYFYEHHFKSVLLRKYLYKDY